MTNKEHVEAKTLEMLIKEKAILFDNAPCGYHLVDEEGFIVSINKTLLQWLGYSQAEVIGKIRFADIVDEEAQLLAGKAAELDAGTITTEIKLIRKDGSTFPVILSLMDTGVLGQDPSKRLYSTIDNSRCHEALERIKTLDQELEAFSYSISHDLRAPLRSIDGYSKILQEDYAGQLDDEGRRVLNVVMNNARRMGKLIDDLLDFGRLGRKQIQYTHINMTSMVENIVQDLRSHEPDRKIDVKIGELLPCHADADMIRQIWFNLLENAFKYTGKTEEGVIEVRSYELGDREACYEVKDNGVGFDMQYSDKLFGVFQRLHRMQDFSGTGVGLAIVKRIVTRHGGRVWAQASVGEGATFCFTLPKEHEN